MSIILKILTDPNPLLRKKSAKISLKEIGSEKIQKLYSDMFKTMLKKEGVGLAAPQIGQNIRLCVINAKDGQICFINPKITRKSWSKEWGEEGCLSVPDVFGQIKRHKKIVCRYLDEKGKETEIEAEGLLSRVIQHEIDHLDGTLFTDKARGIKKIKNE